MRRTRVKRYNANRGGSMFPHVRDAGYRKWVWTENDCLLAGTRTRVRITISDKAAKVDLFTFYEHRCWGPIDPAHVNENAAQGTPDVGELIPLCRAAHNYFDNRREEFFAATDTNQAQLIYHAAGLPQKYVEQGGKLRQAS